MFLLVFWALGMSMIALAAAGPPAVARRSLARQRRR